MNVSKLGIDVADPSFAGAHIMGVIGSEGATASRAIMEEKLLGGGTGDGETMLPSLHI